MKSLTRKLTIFVLALSLFAGTLSVFSLSASAADENRTIKVGFFSYPGYHEIEMGNRGGYGYDFLALLQRYTDINYEFVGYENSWEEMQQMLLDGKIDLVTSARMTPERAEKFDFSESIGTNKAKLNVRFEDERFVPGDFATLNGIVVGIMSGNSRNSDLEQYAKEKGFTYTTREYSDADELSRALSEKKVDAIISSSLRKTSNEKTIAEFAPEDFYAIVKKGNTELLNEINYGIAQMDINEGNWRDDLYYKNYVNKGEHRIAFTSKEIEYIAAVQKGLKKITVAAQPDANPYSFVKNGSLTGIIPDYFAHLMEIAGLPYSVEIAKDRTEFHNWVTTNHTDVVMDFRYGTLMSEMSEFGLVTDSYMKLTSSRVTRKGFSGAVNIIASVDSWGVYAPEEKLAPDFKYIMCKTREEAMQAVKDGKADVCYVYTYTAEQFINTDPDNSLQSTILSSPVYDEYIYVSPNTDHELCSILNKCIKADVSGSLDEIVTKYTTVTFENLSLFRYLKMHPIYIFLGTVLLMSLAALMIVAVYRGRTAKRKDKQLKIELEQQQKLEEALTFTNFFLDTYVSAYFINLETLEYRIYKRTEQLARDYPITDNYYKSMCDYIDNSVHPDDCEELRAITHPDEMKRRLSIEGQFAFLFRDIDGGFEKMYRMQVIAGNDENHAAFGFVDVTGEFAEQKQRLLGAVPLSPDILGKANIGLWAFELDEGKAPRMYVDDTMLGLIGLEHQVTPEETYHAWYDNIDKDSYDLVTDAVDKMVSGDHAEVQYPWHHPNGETFIVRCGGVRNNGYKGGVRIEGTHQNVTEVLHYDEEEQKREREGLSLMLVSALSDAYSSLYYVTAETGEYQLITRDEEFGRKVDSRLSSGGSFYEDSEKSAQDVIYPEDMAKMSLFWSKDRMEEAFEGNDSFSVDYRLVIDDKPVWHRVKIVKIQSTDGVLYYAVGIKSIDDELKQQEELRKNQEIIEILASEYSSVYYINLLNDGLTPYTMNESTETAFGMIFRNGITYSDAYRMYVDEQVQSEDREMMLKAGSIRNIMRELQNKKTFITTYRDFNGHFSEMKFVKVGDETGKPVAVALGFADKDEELRAKQEAEIIRQRNTDIIEILASEYSSVYYIDLTTDELDPYTMNEETESELGHIFRSGIHYSEAFKLYVDSLVYPEDRDMMLEAGSIFNILRELADKKTFLTTYRSENNGNPHYCEMKFVKVGEDDNPRAVALGFADKDDEIRDEMQRKAIAARDAAVIAGLSDDFGCVVYVDFTTGEENHYRFDPLLSASIPGWEDISNFKERMMTLGQKLVIPEDRLIFETPDAGKREIMDIVQREGVYYRNFRVNIEGEIRYYQLKIVRDENSENHIIAGLRNVDETAKRELEYQEKLEAANKSKTDFLFNMSHDIRTPMNAIIGFTQLAKKYIDDKERTVDSLNKIESSGNHLLELINEVLDMSRVEAGKLHSEMKIINVSDAANRLVTICQESAQQRDIKLELNEVNILHPMVVADELHIDQVIMNILGNAVKYTLPGGKVSYTVEEVEPVIEGYGKYIFCVEDTGIGMSQEFLEHIYESFSREHKASTSEIQGTGLGMAIVKRLVDFMDGTIDIESKQGKGTKVIVTLNLKFADSEAARTDKEEVNVTLLEGRKVLLVEDNELNREIAVDMLSEYGLIIDEAVNGIDAVDHVKKRGKGYYDFILMDIQMPLMDGFEATTQIRKLPGMSELPIIALSANAFEEDKVKSIEAGMNDHVSKPIVIDNLVAVLSKYVK